MIHKRTYNTWYEFKKDLQREAERGILTHEWLAIKPKEPLPWNDSTLKMILSDTLGLKDEKPKPIHEPLNLVSRKIATILNRK